MAGEFELLTGHRTSRKKGKTEISTFFDPSPSQEQAFRIDPMGNCNNVPNGMHAIGNIMPQTTLKRGARRGRPPGTKKCKPTPSPSRPQHEQSVTTGSHIYDEIPSKLKIRFSNDYNINSVHSIIVAYLNYQIDGIPSLREEYRQMLDSSKRTSNIIDSKIIMRKAGDLDQRIKSLENSENLNSYLDKSREILEQYNSIPYDVRFADIGSARDENLSQNEILRITAIETYFKIASQYYNLEYIHDFHDPSTECLHCGCTLYDTYTTNESCLTCSSCGAISFSSASSKVVDASQDIMAAKPYLDKPNFRKAFYRYMGMEKVNFDVAKVVDKLDTYFQSKGFSPVSEIKTMDRDIYGKAPGTSLEMLFLGMKECKFTHYEHGNLIGQELWGWKLPQIQHMEETIMNDYDVTQEEYNKIPQGVRMRDSCLSTQFRLFKHLQLRGHICRAGDFKLPTQPESITQHTELWKMMVEGAKKRDPTLFYIP